MNYQQQPYGSPMPPQNAYCGQQQQPYYGQQQGYYPPQQPMYVQQQQQSPINRASNGCCGACLAW
ncbi:hypothetical protein RO3G_15099 [Rhizopus delemar RA 99-880]|uniref:Uncharacterized protein n=1 Tax=Rhizopus delemar (strain RA 99-880 / ATCC MYA-4621 / FGSC 9543 / NRRL 43880) TaxID=246409 RepID=I1CPK8_RHIO9|nr:hypothetical protein RO3G_15099 [Rhizopus delemar RA 99-880]|eukprot:EIE90388.1 hypothetical protein RO3G_15099 [Rhizopus delemar RA 99-880]